MGGGLGINYHHDQSDIDVPGPDELLAAVAPHLLNSKFTVMIEPGRSLIGNAGKLRSSEGNTDPIVQLFFRFFD